MVTEILPPQLVRYANTLLKDKVLFGSDYPVITPDRWLADFDALDIKPEVRPKILKHNAARLLGLTVSVAGPASFPADRSAGRAGRGLSGQAPDHGGELGDGLVGGAHRPAEGDAQR